MIKELIRVNTEKVSKPGHFGIPELTAPLRTYLSLSSETRGLALSTLHPFAFGSPRKASTHHRSAGNASFHLNMSSGSPLAVELVAK